MLTFANKYVSHDMAHYHEKNVDQILKDLLEESARADGCSHVHAGMNTGDAPPTQRSTSSLHDAHAIAPERQGIDASATTGNKPLAFLAGRAQSRIGSADQRAKAHQTLLLVATLLASVQSRQRTAVFSTPGIPCGPTHLCCVGMYRNHT